MGSYCAVTGARYFAFLYSDMGCTSSAPNSASPPPPPLVQTSATDATLDFEHYRTGDVDMERKEYRQNLVGVTEIAEVPVAELVDKVEVDRTIAPSKVSDLTNEDIPVTAELSQRDNCNETKTFKIEYKKDLLDTEERLSRLEEVVEKVVELYVTENHSTVHDLEENTKDQSIFVTNEHEFEDEMKDKNEEISVPGSPSSVNSSDKGGTAVATRWEALADIAAELPPSLAVDPLTGQIYALSK